MKRAKRTRLLPVYNTPADIQKALLELGIDGAQPRHAPKPDYLLLAYLLSSERRMQILLAINGSPMTVTQLCKLVDSRQSLVSRDLAILREAGIVHGTKRGLHTVYEIRYDRLRELVLELVSRFECTRKES